MRVLVVGGGIAGLTTAAVLGRLGHQVVVAERSADFDTVGAGIGLAEGAEAILDTLGVHRAEIGAPIRRLEVRDAAGRVLQGFDPPSGRSENGEPTMRAYARPDLHRALVVAAGEVAELRGGQQPDAAERAAYDLVVGADGISSATRHDLMGEVPIRYSGATCWRAIVPNFGVENSFEAWGDGVRVGAIPLAGGHLYGFLVRACDRRSPAPPDLGTLAGSTTSAAKPAA